MAFTTTLTLLLLGTPVALWLSKTSSALKLVFEPIVALPLILPPTVIGFYLLIAFAPDSPFGSMWMSLTGSRLAFTFEALVIGSVIYSLPFYLQPLQRAFESVDSDILDAAATMGAGSVDRFFTVMVPLSRRGFITATDIKPTSVIILADVPLANMFGYATDLRSMSQGQASFSMEFASYRRAPSTVQEEIVERIRKEKDGASTRK